MAAAKWNRVLLVHMWSYMWPVALHWAALPNKEELVVIESRQIHRFWSSFASQDFVYSGWWRLLPKDGLKTVGWTPRATRLPAILMPTRDLQDFNLGKNDDKTNIVNLQETFLGGDPSSWQTIYIYIFYISVMAKPLQGCYTLVTFNPLSP